MNWKFLKEQWSTFLNASQQEKGGDVQFIVFKENVSVKLIFPNQIIFIVISCK